jgi:hypothetical protein
MFNNKARLDARSRKIKSDKNALDIKRAKIKELATIINMQPEMILPIEVKQDIDNEQFRLEFALAQLKREFSERECDLKIAAMEKVIGIMKQHRPQ